MKTGQAKPDGKQETGTRQVCGLRTKTRRAKPAAVKLEKNRNIRTLSVVLTKTGQLKSPTKKTQLEKR